MYTYSSEVRWFFPGTVRDGDALLAWFVKPLSNYGRDPKDLWVLEADDPANPRIDEYLILPGTKTVGTKLRGGDRESSFEVKAQARAPAPWSGVDRVSGCVDAWTKWSFKHQTLNPALDAIRQNGTWIRIAKDRWLRKISVDAGKATFVAANAKAYKKDSPDPALRQLPASGCNFELTRVFIENDRTDPKQAWSTICFEAFAPDPDRTGSILDACARLAFDQLGIPPGVELTERTSLSYPDWFAALQARR